MDTRPSPRYPVDVPGTGVELLLADPRAQAGIDHEAIHEWTLPDGSPWTRFFRVADGYLLRFPGLADFAVSVDGGSVQAWPVPGIPEDSLRQLYLNQVLPLALSRRDHLVFHASAVEIGTVAAAFMGESGRGKSTLAASFATGGFRFLADDGLVLEMAAGEWHAAPSHPSIRLWDDSHDALIGAAVRAAPPAHFTAKGRFLAGDEMVFCGAARPLARLYLLDELPEYTTTIEPIPAKDALIELVRHSFLMDIGERSALAAHFEQLASLANRTPCFRLDYPRQFELLPQVRAAIVAHVREGCAP